MEHDALLAAKLEAIAEFAAGAGHEINNPLAAISGRAQLLLRDETDPERRRHLQTIGAQALRIRDMIGDVMLFARPPEPQPQRVNLVAIIDDVLSKFAGDLAESRISINTEYGKSVPVWADETQLRIVLSELLRNAIRFSPQEKTIRIDAVCESEDLSTFTVHDEGPGLSDTDREHLFDPFYSGRQAGRGLGFGLPKCWRIVTRHGGRITADCGGGKGLVITVHWPAAEAPLPPGERDSL